jgi:hypothetical protein
MILKKVFYFVSMAFVALLMSGCLLTSGREYPPDLENSDLQPVNTNQNYRLMIEKQQSTPQTQPKDDDSVSNITLPR